MRLAPLSMLALCRALQRSHRRPLATVVRRATTAEQPPLHLHDGDRVLPPMVQADGSKFGLDKGLVRPPDADALWEWYVATGRDARDPDPSWGDVWDSARALAAHLRSDARSVAGLRCVELGAGLGVVGLAAARAGAAAVTLVDREPECLHCAMATASLNGLSAGAAGAPGVIVSAAVGDFAAVDVPRADVVLGSDILYDGAAMAALADACERLAPRALIADPVAGRAEGARAAFVAAAAARGGTITEQTLDTGDAEPTLLLAVDWA